jgi:hypothetical protein
MKIWIRVVLAAALALHFAATASTQTSQQTPSVPPTPPESILEEIAAQDAAVRSMTSARRLEDIPDAVPFERGPYQTERTVISREIDLHLALAGFDTRDVITETDGNVVTVTGQYSDGDVVITGQYVDGLIELRKEFRPLVASGDDVGEPIRIRYRYRDTAPAQSGNTGAGATAPQTSAPSNTTQPVWSDAPRLYFVPGPGEPGDSYIFREEYRLHAAIPRTSDPGETVTVRLTTPSGDTRIITLHRQQEHQGVVIFEGGGRFFSTHDRAPVAPRAGVDRLAISSGDIVQAELLGFSGQPARATALIYATDVEQAVARNREILNFIGDQLVAQRIAADALLARTDLPDDVRREVREWRAYSNVGLRILSEGREGINSSTTPQAQLVQGNDLIGLFSLDPHLWEVLLHGRTYRIRDREVVTENQVSVAMAATLGTYLTITELSGAGPGMRAMQGWAGWVMDNVYDPNTTRALRERMGPATDQFGNQITTQDQQLAFLEVFGGIYGMYRFPRIVDWIADGRPMNIPVPQWTPKPGPIVRLGEPAAPKPPAARPPGARRRINGREMTEGEDIIARANDDGLTIAVNRPGPDDPAAAVTFLDFAGRVTPKSHVLIELTPLHSAKVKTMLEALGRPQRWTPEEVQLVRQRLLPEGERLTKWMEFRIDEEGKGLVQLFDLEFVNSMRSVFGGGRRVTVELPVPPRPRAAAASEPPAQPSSRGASAGSMEQSGTGTVIERPGAGQPQPAARSGTADPAGTRVDPGQTRIDPGQTRIDWGQTRIDPGQTRIDPGQTRIDPGQTRIDPGQTRIDPSATTLEPPSRTARGTVSESEILNAPTARLQPDIPPTDIYSRPTDILPDGQPATTTPPGVRPRAGDGRRVDPDAATRIDGARQGSDTWDGSSDAVSIADDVIVARAQMEGQQRIHLENWTGEQIERLRQLARNPDAFQSNHRGPLTPDEITHLTEAAAAHRGPGDTQVLSAGEIGVPREIVPVDSQLLPGPPGGIRPSNTPQPGTTPGQRPMSESQIFEAPTEIVRPDGTSPAVGDEPTRIIPPGAVTDNATLMLSGPPGGIRPPQSPPRVTTSDVDYPSDLPTQILPPGSETQVLRTPPGGIRPPDSAGVIPGSAPLWQSLPGFEFTLVPIRRGTIVDLIAQPGYLAVPAPTTDAAWDPTVQRMIMVLRLKVGNTALPPAVRDNADRKPDPGLLRHAWGTIRAAFTRPVVSATILHAINTAAPLPPRSFERAETAPEGASSSEQQGAGANGPGLRAILTSLGTSTGEAFTIQVLNDGPEPVELSGEGLVVEPLTRAAQNEVQRQLAKLAGSNAVTAKVNAYCLEFLRQPPSAGTIFRIAAPDVQQRYAPMRSILQAAERLELAGQLRSDGGSFSDYVHSIRQWALWAREQDFSLEGFQQAFIEHTRKNVMQAGQRWTSQLESAVEQFVPHRWEQIRMVLDAADGR